VRTQKHEEHNRQRNAYEKIPKLELTTTDQGVAKIGDEAVFAMRACMIPQSQDSLPSSRTSKLGTADLGLNQRNRREDEDEVLWKIERLIGQTTRRKSFQDPIKFEPSEGTSPVTLSEQITRASKNVLHSEGLKVDFCIQVTTC
jgi:hypothetical protein